MDKKDLIGNVYDDFFGVNKMKKENEKLINEIEVLNAGKSQAISSMLDETRSKLNKRR